MFYLVFLWFFLVATFFVAQFFSSVATANLPKARCQARRRYQCSRPCFKIRSRLPARQRWVLSRLSGAPSL